MTDAKSLQLAKLWVSLSDIKTRIDNEVVPVGGHLGIEDPDLMISLEDVSEKIGKHFEKFRLVAEARRQRTALK